MPHTILLFDAIDRYYRLLTADDPDARRDLEELERWFESRDEIHPDAFERLCRQHRVEPGAIRRLLQQARHATGRE